MEEVCDKNIHDNTATIKTIQYNKDNLTVTLAKTMKS